MLNSIVLMGRVCADPELKHTATDLAVSEFTIACERSYARNGEEKIADFFNITTFGAKAEFASRYYRKGQLVAVKGRLQTDSYTDREGAKRKAYKIMAEELFFADSKKDTGQEDAATQHARTQGDRPAPAYT